jgi:copper chaperone NosL
MRNIKFVHLRGIFYQQCKRRNIRLLLLTVFMLILSSNPAIPAAPPGDVLHFPSCGRCGMDRGMFSHSRMLIEYADGSKAASCSLHCVAVDLALTIDKIPVMVRVADYDSKELLDVDKAVWVLGGSKKGVMTAQAKWAFTDRGAAERFVKANGGSLVSFDEAIKAAYDDMYQDTKMIRELRKMKRAAPKAGGGHP